MISCRSDVETESTGKLKQICLFKLRGNLLRRVRSTLEEAKQKNINVAGGSVTFKDTGMISCLCVSGTNTRNHKSNSI